MGWGREAWGVSGGAGGDDNTPPSVSAVPNLGTIDRHKVIKITVTDLYLKRVQVTAEYASGAWEVVYMQDRFSLAYSGSHVVHIPTGLELHVSRRSGWFAPPTLHVDTYDTSANEA